MSSNPHAHFDQTILDMIDHSPTGAVPSTPAYQDALNRLYAAHQVYASADHKGCHVTARSLATAPHFHADNLDALIAGSIAPEALEPNASIFDRYVHSLSLDLRKKAEGCKAVVAGRVAHHRAKHGVATVHDPVHTLFLVPGTGPHHGLPGNYLHGSAFQLTAEAASPWAVHLHDSDDGAALFDAPDMAAALAKLSEVMACAPFNMSELEALGFRLN